MSEKEFVSKTDWTRVFVAYVSLFVLGFLDSVRGPFFPDITNDLNLTDSVASLFFVVASTMTIFSGRITPWLVERTSLSFCLKLAQLLIGIGCLGFSVSFALSTLLISAVVFGLGFGFINVGQNLLILEGAALHRRRQLFSGLHSVYALASLCAPIAVGVLVATGFDWRESFRLFTALCAMGFFACFAVRSKPQKQVAVQDHSGLGVKKAWIYLPVAIQMSFYLAAELSISTRLVLFLRRDANVDAALAPQYLAGFFALLLLGRLVFTFLPFRNHSNRKIMMSSLLASALVYILGLHYSPYWLILCGLTMAPMIGASLEYMADIFPGHSDKAIAWVLASSGFFIISMHYAIGLLTEYYGIGKALNLGPAMLIVSAFLLWRAHRQESDHSGGQSVKT